VIVSSDELHPVIEHSLDSELTGVLAGIVDANLQHASADEIAGVVAPVIERAERDREQSDRRAGAGTGDRWPGRRRPRRGALNA
jgi:hypothetical protein